MRPPTRRSFLAASGAASLSGLAGCTTVSRTLARFRSHIHDSDADLSGESGPWPTLGHDAQRSGFRPDAPAFGRDVRIVSTPVAGVIYETPPVVASDTLLTCRDGYVSTDEGEMTWHARLVAHGTKTGDERWRLTGETDLSTPTVVGQTCFVVVDERTVALDRKTGKQHWRNTVGYADAERAPAVADGRVYVADDRLHALDAVTGEQLWQTETELEDGVHGVAATEDVVCVTTGSGGHGRLYAFDPDGSLRWDAPQVGESYAPPVVGDEYVYAVRTSRFLHAVSLADGTSTWTARRGGTAESVAVADGTVFFTDARERRVVALDARTGDERWTFEMSASELGRGLVPQVGGNVVYVAVGTDPSRMVALDRETGQRRWQRELGVEPLTGPVVGDKSLYVGAASIEGESWRYIM